MFRYILQEKLLSKCLYRLYYCIFYWELYADDPISILYIWEGGLAIYGGIIGGAITLLVVAKRKKIPAPVLLDVAGMGVIIGQLMGRWETL